MKKTLSAATVRLLLVILLIISLASIAAGAFFAYSFLRTTADEIAQLQSEDAATDAKINTILSLKKQLDRNETVVKKANQIAAESASYQYQNQIISDLTSLANQANIPITSFTFKDAAAASTSSPTTNTSSAQSPASTPASTTLKSTFVSIQLGDKIPYQNFLHFLHLLEQNVTRMQVSGVSLSTSNEGGGSTLSSQTLELEVYIK